MISIIVVDDDVNYQELIKNIINKVSIQIDVEPSVKYFTKYNKELQKEISDTSIYKIFILDIELNHSISGVSIAEKIRCNDWESEIIFVTNHDKMFETVYRTIYNVFAFIEKFHDFDKKLEQSLKKILKKNFDNQMFSYTSRNIDLSIYYRSILYIYCDKEKRKLVIVAGNNEYLVGYNLQEMIKHLDSRFKMVHRSCIVNQDHVQEYNWTKGYFKLDTGEEIPLLSKRFRK